MPGSSRNHGSWIENGINAANGYRFLKLDMLSGIQNTILIAALGAILGMAESSSASTLSLPVTCPHSPARQVAFAHSRVANSFAW